MEAIRHIDQQLATQSEEEAKVIAEYYGLLANVASYSGVGYGVAINYFRQHKTQVKHLLNARKTLHRYPQPSQVLYRGIFPHAQEFVPAVVRRAESMVGRARQGMNLDRDNLKRSLGLSTKGLVYRPDPGSRQRFFDSLIANPSFSPYPWEVSGQPTYCFLKT